VKIVAAAGTSRLTQGDIYYYVGPSVSAVNPPGGPSQGGTSLTITGSGFSGAKQVTLDGRPATFRVASDREICAITPAGSNGSAAGVVVTTPIGSSPVFSVATEFRYTDSPVLEAISPDSGTTGGGTWVTIRGANFTGVNAVYFGRLRAASFRVTGATSIFAESPATTSAGQANINVVTGAGQSATWGTLPYSYVALRPGYWIATAQGDVFSYGAAAHLAPPSARYPGIVAIAASNDGGGYWLVSSAGAVQAFGDARFYGSMSGSKLQKPIVGIAPTLDGGGYWMVASDGGVFAFGDARFYGSMGAKKLNSPIVAMAATPDGSGYWMVASDGGVFAFGDATFHGSMGGRSVPFPFSSMAISSTGGYWILDKEGDIYPFAAPELGDPASLTNQAAGVAST
jgi:hypothetical protein